jgi:hypothetical protein
MEHGSRRIRAARWVITLSTLYWGLLVLAAAWSLLGVVFSWSAGGLLVPLLLAGAASAWGALTRAFEAHRRGAWQLLVGLSAAAAGGTVIGWLAGAPVTALALVSAALECGLLALLLHPDSRDWVAADEPQERWTEPVGRHPDGGH